MTTDADAINDQLDIDFEALGKETDAEWKAEYRRLVVEYSRLPLKLQWQTVKRLLLEYYGFLSLIINAGSSSRRDHIDMAELKFQLSVFYEILGTWEVYLVEQSHKIREFKPAIGIHEYYRRYFQVEGVIPLPDNAIAFQLADEIESNLGESSPSAKVAVFRSIEAVEVTVWHQERRNRFLFCDFGFASCVPRGYDGPTQCGWEDPGFFDVLQSALSFVTGVKFHL